MSKVQEAEKLLAAMTRAEKAQVLQRVVCDLGEAFPGIDSMPGVCGGEPCIVRTRIQDSEESRVEHLIGRYGPMISL
jgi:hypothetical protein